MRDPARTVSELVETVWIAGDLDALPSFWTPDCVNHAAPAGRRDGLEALRTYHEDFVRGMAGLADVEIRIARQVSDGTTVASHLFTSATHVGDAFGVPATRRRLTLESMRIDRVEDGLIAEHWSIADRAGLAEQLS